MRGDFTLKEWLERHSEAERKREERGKVMAVKKQQRGRDEGMAQQYFLKQKKNATPLIFRMYEDQKSDGIIISILPYHFWVERVGANGETEREKLEKLRVLYCLKIDNEAEVDAVVTRDAKVTSLEIQPQREKEGRYQVPLDVIQKAADEGRPIQVTLNEGSVFRGTIDWHSTYFIKMKVAPNASIVVFNHSLHEVRDVSPEPAASGRKSARR
ncbi:MAG: hypothetical protein FJX76_11555 [Armatimonadetes bacterium]|nr:hypothetical protein [Armatimonadota bacterium]